jgi:hypothetical protein
MNYKLIFKTLFIIAILSLLVIMGLNNPQTIDLRMTQIYAQTIKGPAALIFFGFFGIGFLAGTIIMVGGGGGKKGSSGSSKKD